MKELNMSVRKGAAAAVALGLVTALGACASGVGAGDYARSSVGQINRVDEGVVLRVRPVRIEGTRTIIGPAAGAAVGGVAGSTIGGGDEERAIGAIAGAVLGGLAGAAAEQGLTRRQGFAYTVRLQDGEVVNIVQGADMYIEPGTPVYIEYGDRARVIPR
jgi:outer membrane lipoprotein SlyB